MTCTLFLIMGTRTGTGTGSGMEGNGDKGRDGGRNMEIC
jgi:hypothetical protein